MIDPVNVARTPFEESHLLAKLQKAVMVSRIWEDTSEPRSLIYGVHSFDLRNSAIYQQIKADYELVRTCIKEQGFAALSGKMGKYIQPRTKGAGHGSTSRAFYARTTFLKQIIDLH